MKSDLSKRIPTGILYVVVIAGALLYNSVASIILLWLFLGICTYEFLSVEFKGAPSSMSLVQTLLTHFVVSLALVLSFSSLEILALSGIISIFFLITGLMLWSSHKSLLTLLPPFIRTLFYLALPFMLIINGVHNHAEFRYIVLGSFIIIWLNDAAAYFVGRAIGRLKILPAVSPGKSWEGWIGGIVVGTLACFIISRYLTVLSNMEWVVLAIVLGIIGLLGDLTESNWKRSHNIKDSSSILPGHGGFLDRLDSFIYSLPFIILYYNYILTQ